MRVYRQGPRPRSLALRYLFAAQAQPLLTCLRVQAFQPSATSIVTQARQATFEDLPVALLASIVEKLPRLVDRVRCALVAKRWAGLLGDPAFWVRLDFEGASEKRLSDEVILGLCRRAAGQLRVLDISAHCCSRNNRINESDFLEDMATAGLGAQVESFTGSQMDLWDIRSLRAAFPALSVAEVGIRVEVQKAVAALRALAGVRGVKSLRIHPSPPPGHEDAVVPFVPFSAFAPALADALAQCPVDAFAVQPTNNCG